MKGHHSFVRARRWLDFHAGCSLYVRSCPACPRRLCVGASLLRSRSTLSGVRLRIYLPRPARPPPVWCWSSASRSAASVQQRTASSASSELAARALVECHAARARKRPQTTSRAPAPLPANCGRRGQRGRYLVLGGYDEPGALSVSCEDGRYVRHGQLQRLRRKGHPRIAQAQASVHRREAQYSPPFRTGCRGALLG